MSFTAISNEYFIINDKNYPALKPEKSLLKF